MFCKEGPVATGIIARLARPVEFIIMLAPTDGEHPPDYPLILDQLLALLGWLSVQPYFRDLLGGYW
jgi:hypothetical protein